MSKTISDTLNGNACLYATHEQQNADMPYQPILLFQFLIVLLCMPFNVVHIYCSVVHESRCFQSIAPLFIRTNVTESVSQSVYYFNNPHKLIVTVCASNLHIFSSFSVAGTLSCYTFVSHAPQAQGK